MSTKFFDYVAMKKKIAVFSKPGVVPEYVVKSGIGYAITPENMTDHLLKIISDFDENRLQFPSGFDTNQFSLEHLTSQYEQLFI